MDGTDLSEFVQIPVPPIQLRGDGTVTTVEQPKKLKCNECGFVLKYKIVQSPSSHEKDYSKNYSQKSKDLSLGDI